MAIITAVGKSRNKNSTPFFVGTNKQKSSATKKLTINNHQLFLKELFTASAFGDFKMSAKTVSSSKKYLNPKNPFLHIYLCL